MPDNLIKFWKAFNEETAPHIHPKDENLISPTNMGFIKTTNNASFSDYINGDTFGTFNDPRFDLSLLPIPYGGDLNKADIFILLLNPGLSYTDYYGEFEVSAYRNALTKNLHQDLLSEEFPFLWLNPMFCWHSGFIYWEQKLRSVLKEIADMHFNGNYLNAMKSLSNRIALLELVPYHSNIYQGRKIIEELPSVKKARSYALNHLYPETLSGKKTVIVTRQAKGWGFKEENTNLIIYKGAETRGASLSINSRGGQAILRQCC